MDFNTALDKPASDFEPPKLMPIGTYIWTVSKPHENKVVGKDNNWDMVTFFVQCVSPTEDVDPDDLDEFGSVAKHPGRVSFLFSKDPDEKNNWLRTMGNLKSFLYNTLQIEESDSLGQDLSEAVNRQFMGVMKHSPDKRSEGTFQEEIGSTAAVD